MLRKTLVVIFVALFMALAMPSRAQAWGCYHYSYHSSGYGGGGYHYSGYHSGGYGGSSAHYGGYHYGGYGGSSYHYGYARRW